MHRWRVSNEIVCVYQWGKSRRKKDDNDEGDGGDGGGDEKTNQLNSSMQWLRFSHQHIRICSNMIGAQSNWHLRNGQRLRIISINSFIRFGCDLAFGLFECYVVAFTWIAHRAHGIHIHTASFHHTIFIINIYFINTTGRIRSISINLQTMLNKIARRGEKYVIRWQ